MNFLYFRLVKKKLSFKLVSLPLIAIMKTMKTMKIMKIMKKKKRKKESFFLKKKKVIK